MHYFKILSTHMHEEPDIVELSRGIFDVNRSYQLTVKYINILPINFVLVRMPIPTVSNH